MPDVAEHYENVLAKHYSWLFGGFEAKAEENRKFFRSHGISPTGNGEALDLGAGSGFQSLPLAEGGFRVTAIDLSPTLLDELAVRRDLPIEIIVGDFLEFTAHAERKYELCVCMGDTLTHLRSRHEVEKLSRSVFAALEENGTFVLTFRDLMFELKDVDRFIPVVPPLNVGS